MNSRNNVPRQIVLILSFQEIGLTQCNLICDVVAVIIYGDIIYTMDYEPEEGGVALHGLLQRKPNPYLR